jgi:hypothetical protein
MRGGARGAGGDDCGGHNFVNDEEWEADYNTQLRILPAVQTPVHAGTYVLTNRCDRIRYSHQTGFF